MIWVKNYNWGYYFYPESNVFKPSKAILELRERAKRIKEETKNEV